MTIVHHIFSPDFPYRAAVHRWSTRTNRGTRVTEARVEGTSSRITSTPWEGLYLEMDENVDNAVPDSLPPKPDLERFLTGIMYGE